MLGVSSQVTCLMRYAGLRCVLWVSLVIGQSALGLPGQAQPPRSPDRTVECDILVVGGGLAGVATAYEGLLAGRTLCMTEITDWVGGQITAQGTSALDEVKEQRRQLFYPRGYKELRQRIQQHYGTLNPGNCWVSVACFLPQDAERILMDMLREAAQTGRGKLHWLPSTVVKEVERSADGKLIQAAIAIQHRPAPNTPPLNTEPLSQTIEEAYRYESSSRFSKSIIRLVPRSSNSAQPPAWIVIDATETGELLALTDVPYQLGLDPRSFLNPSSPTEAGDPYCVQGHTYTFAMQQTEQPQPQPEPSFYQQYQPYYGYDPDPKRATFDYVFTYRRLWAPQGATRPKAPYTGVGRSQPGDISMQNWVWGNDYRPGTATDNLIYSRSQLQQRGQLESGGWLGGLRTESLQKGEELALGFYHWLTAGTTDRFLPNVKKPALNHILMTGLNSPMGTLHGLSKYPYIREGRRLIGRPSYAYPTGFVMAEVDISWADFRQEYYRNLPGTLYPQLWTALAGLDTTAVIRSKTPPEQIQRRTRSTMYPDAIGIAQYAIDFHPCMATTPPEAAGNEERSGVRQAHGTAYPGQIPLRAMIPQQIDNLLVAGKSIATSYSVAAAYRVHSFEWSVGAAAGTTADWVLKNGILPYQLVDNLPRPEPLLEKLQQRLQANGNPIAFPNTSITNLNWEKWKPW